MTTLSKIFLKGLVTVLPAVITLYLLYWLGVTAESVLGGLIKLVLPPAYYWPGMGVVVGLAGVFFIGLLMNAWLVGRLFRVSERLLEHIPLVKTIYGAMKDLMGFFSESGARNFSQVVVVEISGARLLGLVTREEFAGLPDALGGEDTVAVYMPMSYQVGGYTLMVPRSRITPIDMPLQDAMRFAVTAGMSAPSESMRTAPTNK